MKIHCVQLNIEWENKAANFARVEALLRASPPERDSLVLLPEMFATGFSMNVPAVREDAKRSTEQFLAALARRHQAYVTGGLVDAGANHRGRNVAATFNPEGVEVARYNKLQPFTPGGEADNYEAGQEVMTWNWRGLNVAPFICYDLRFPEHFRRAAHSRVEIITVIANWPVARIQHWVTLLQARAIENQAFVAGVNRCGQDPKLQYNGRSLIVGPKGDILADAGNGECVVSAELDLDALKAYRKDFPFLEDMRR
jgi:predicted amidohydrolase